MIAHFLRTVRSKSIPQSPARSLQWLFHPGLIAPFFIKFSLTVSPTAIFAMTRSTCKPGVPSRTRYGFQGGDLAGITEKLDYLLDLGINAIYLNPIFMAASTHRYDTIDYLRIDPKLGSLEDFHALIDAAHRRQIRVVLDGVFNHCSRGFFAFNDILENEAESPYLDWFHIRHLPLRAYEPGHARNYLAWWGIKSLPKFNTNNPEVRRYLLKVARYWIEQGADGWRLDVPNEIDDDEFWAEFRQVVHTTNPEAYLLGEIWETVPRWANDTHFDGLMNYPVRTAILDYLNGKRSTAEFSVRIEALLTIYPRENVFAQYNLLGSHDTERVITLLEGDLRKLRLAYLFQFAYPGIPAIYYGDEIGLEGGKDPDCRRAFPWNMEQWDTGLRNWVKALIAIRKTSLALQMGDFQPLYACDTPPCYAFARVLKGEKIIVAMNASAERATLTIPTGGLGLDDGPILYSLLDDRQLTVENGLISLSLEPFSGVYLAAHP